MSEKSHMDDDYQLMFGEPISDWYRWFAWHPVDTADRGWQWLRVVKRRRIQPKFNLPDFPGFWFQHAVTTLTETEKP